MMKITGKRASPGRGEGRPVVVQGEEQLADVREGDVLVAAQTDIAYVPAMHRASAIITETGGRFCHAAVWAREHGKPTLLQVERATELLDGVIFVVVDADAETVEWGAGA